MNILVVDAWLPVPNRDSGSLRVVNLLGILQEFSDNITFAVPGLYARPGGRALLQGMGIRVMEEPQADGLASHLQAHGSAYDLIILSRLPQAVAYMALARQSCPNACILFDTTDLHHVRTYRAAKTIGNIRLLQQALEMKRDELAAVNAADATLVVSTVEKELLAKECPAARVTVVSNIHPVLGSARPFDERRGILFVGAFPHHPNQDGMRYFMDTVYPLWTEKMPSVPLSIVGSEPPDWLTKRSSDTIRVLGFVPDMEPLLNSTRLSIAPLRYGAGVKGKVLQSMSYGVPVVGTSIAAEGITHRDRVEMRIADTPTEFCAAMCELYEDQDLWNRLSQNSLELVRQNFSAQAARQALLGLFQELGVMEQSRK